MIIRSKAPLRLGLAGGGTDISTYSDKYGGAVLNVTIDMYAHCTIEPTEEGTIEFYATDLDKKYATVSGNTQIELEGELLLHKGVYNRIKREFCPDRELSFKMTTYCEAPSGSGLGSSSTVVVSMIKAYMEWLNLPLGEYDMASMAYEIEREEIGLSGGKQDQYAATFGGFNFIEFGKEGHVVVNPLRLKNWIKNEVESSLIMYYTGTSRDSANIIDEQVATAQKSHGKSLESMHQLKEASYNMKDVILRGDFDGLAECLSRTWEVKKKTASVISNHEIEETYDYVMKHGGKAAKISGAGGGGFMMIICNPAKRYLLIQALKQLDEGQVFTTSFTDKGTQAWTLY